MLEVPARPRYDPSNEIFVRREEILELFSDQHGSPPSKATFFRYVDTGKVKKARGLQGWYKLNATRVELGMGPVDVNERCLRRLAQKQFYRDAQLLHDAVIELDKSLENFEVSFNRGEERLLSEEKTVRRNVERLQGVSTTGSSVPSKEYLRGFLRGLSMLLESNEDGDNRVI